MKSAGIVGAACSKLAVCGACEVGHRVSQYTAALHNGWVVYPTGATRATRLLLLRPIAARAARFSRFRVAATLGPETGACQIWGASSRILLIDIAACGGLRRQKRAVFVPAVRGVAKA